MKYILKTLKYLSLIILLFILYPYIICPIYKFATYKEFSGEKLYNPYSTTNNYKWYKVNMHAHTNAWYGITTGNSISDSVISKYKHFGFDIIGISDYMKINSYLSNNTHYIPVYEHGFWLSKVHQLSIGAKKVVWHDFFIYFNVHQKQYIINKVKGNSDMIALNHPRHMGAYTPYDLKQLTNYDCFEVLNRSWFSIALWDTLLSTGHYVPLIANDDCHDISNVYDVGTNYTMVRAKSIDKNDIISAMKQGSTIGVDINMENNETFKTKLIKINGLPTVKNISTNDSTLIITTDIPIREFKFIGQNGKVKKVVSETDSASYIFNNSDTYIRTEITTTMSSKLYLNPIFRTNNNIPVKLQSEVDFTKTLIYRMIWFIIAGIILFIVYRKKKILF